MNFTRGYKKMRFFNFGKSSTAYIPGNTVFFKYGEMYDLYQRILSKLKISYSIFDKQISCGLDAFEAGYENEARKLARKNLEFFNEQGISNLITTSPECYKAYTIDIPSILPDWNIKVKNIWEIIANKLVSKSKLIKFKAMELVSFLQRTKQLDQLIKLGQEKRPEIDWPSS